MKYSIKQYAESLLWALADKSKEERRLVLRRFIATLRKNKDLSRLNLIWHEAERQELKKLGLRKVEIESASEVSKTLKKEIENILGKRLFIKEKVKPELLAGIRILVDQEYFIDATAKRKLDKLFLK